MNIGKPRKIITVEPDPTAVPDEGAEPVPAVPEEEQPTTGADGR